MTEYESIVWPLVSRHSPRAAPRRLERRGRTSRRAPTRTSTDPFVTAHAAAGCARHLGAHRGALRRAGVRPRRSPCRADRGAAPGDVGSYAVGGRAQDRVLSRAQPRLERVRREPRRRRAAACGHSSKGGGPASWSPDGQSVAFQSEDDGNEDIYVANADGSGRRNLTRNEAWDFGPTWSPDGRKIAFASNRDGNRDLRHERGRERPAEPEPQWRSTSPSPGRPTDGGSRSDGSHIQDTRPHVMNADGSGQRRLMPAGRTSPRGRPMGERSCSGAPRRQPGDLRRERGRERAASVDAQRGERRRTRMVARRPKIAFLSRRNGDADVYVMRADGTALRRVTRGPENDWFAGWSPDGGRSPTSATAAAISMSTS